MKNIPPSLYKYRSFDNNSYYKDLIVNNLMFFSSPLNFNDPFDCRVIPTYESIRKNNLYELAKKNIKEANPNISKVKLKKHAKELTTENFSIIKDPKLFSERINEVLNNFFGIFTLTENNKNILMWSHYADSHRGFCLEFDATRLNEVLCNHITVNELLYMDKVLYKREYPIISPLLFNAREDNAEKYLDWLFVKSVDWEYEKEWRIIFFKHPNEKLWVPDDVFRAIYFGVMCSDDNIQQIMKLTRNKKIQYYKAKILRYEFGIEFEEL